MNGLIGIEIQTDREIDDSVPVPWWKDEKIEIYG